MDFRRLRYFAAVAEELNFRRAADVLNTSQPSLSQQIRALEDEIGIQLFERTKRSVRLTRAGSVYLAGVREAIAEIDACAARAREAQAGARGALSIGANGMVMIDHVPRIVRRFRAAFPDVSVSVTILRTPDIVGALRAGHIELAFANAVEPDADIDATVLWSLASCVVLPAGHPHARDEHVRLSDLAGETLITHPRRGGGGANGEVLTLCREQGFTPKAIKEVAEIADLETLIGLVACGLGVTILPSPFAQAAPPGVVFKPIAGTTRGPRISACWRRRESNALVRNFVAVATDLARASEGDRPSGGGIETVAVT
jgi:DNA-binding transcriptional LysR family regulator